MAVLLEDVDLRLRLLSGGGAHGALLASNNLDDLASLATAQTNLGLQPLATTALTGTPSSLSFLRGDYSWQLISSLGGLNGSTQNVVTQETSLVEYGGLAPIFTLYHANGVVGAPTAILSGDELGTFQFDGQYDTTANHEWSGASIFATALENYDATHAGSSLTFAVTPSGATTLNGITSFNSYGQHITSSVIQTGAPTGQLGTDLLIDIFQFVQYSPGGGPKPFTGVGTGFASPRAHVELEGTFRFDVNSSTLYGAGPGFQHAIVYENISTSAVNIAVGTSFLAAPQIYAVDKSLSLATIDGSDNRIGKNAGPWSIAFYESSLFSQGSSTGLLYNVQHVGVNVVPYFNRGTHALRRYGLVAQDINDGSSVYTTVAAASSGVAVSTFAGAGVLTVAGTSAFPSSGSITVQTSSTAGIARIDYTGVTSTTFTGCTTVVGTGNLSNSAGSNAVSNHGVVQSQVGLILGKIDTDGTSVLPYSGAVSNTAMQIAGQIDAYPNDCTFTTTPFLPGFLNFPATYTLDFPNAGLGSILAFNGNVVFKQSAFVMVSGYTFGATFKNDSASAVNLGTAYLFLARPTFEADSQAGIQASASRDMWSDATYKTTGSGSPTLTALSHESFRSSFTVGAGATVTTRYGMNFIDAANSGTITSQIAINIPTLSGATGNHGIINAASLEQSGTATFTGTVNLSGATLVGFPGILSDGTVNVVTASNGIVPLEGVAQAPIWFLERINNNTGAPQAVTSGQVVGAVYFGGQYDTTVNHTGIGAKISGIATQTYAGSGALGTQVVIATVSNGGGSTATAITFDQDQSTIFGGPLYGGTGATDDLILSANNTSHTSFDPTVRHRILTTDPIWLYGASAVTFTARPYFLYCGAAIALNNASGGADMGDAYQFAPTITIGSTASGFGMAAIINNAATFQNDPAVSASFDAVYSLVSQYSLVADTKAGLSIGTGREVVLNPTFTTAVSGGTGTITSGTHDHIYIAGKVDNGVTISLRRGIYIKDYTHSTARTNGTVTTQYGIYIDTLTNAGTNVGLYNAATSSLVGNVTCGGTLAVTGNITGAIVFDTDPTIRATSAAGITFIRDAGTAITNGTSILNLVFQGARDSSGNVYSGAEIQAIAEEDYATSGTHSGTRLTFLTSAIGSGGTLSTRGGFDNAGVFFVGTSGTRVHTVDGSGNGAFSGTLGVTGLTSLTTLAVSSTSTFTLAATFNADPLVKPTSGASGITFTRDEATAVTSGTAICNLVFSGARDASGNTYNAAEIQVVADETFATSGTHSGARLTFLTSANGSGGTLTTRGGFDNAGILFIGTSATRVATIDSTGALAALSATLTQSTTGVIVHQLTSTATNDDPTEQVIQDRITTTNATPTSFATTISVPASTTTMVEAMVIARRTGGSSGATDDGAGYVVRGVFKGTGIIGSSTTTAVAESQAAWDVGFAAVSSNTVALQVTGAANNNITWHVTYRVWRVGT